jgi:hypothetical protein
MMDFDKTPSNDTESNNSSDEDDLGKKKQRSSIDDDNDDLDGSDPRNIWRKRRKLSDHHQISSVVQTEKTKVVEQDNSKNNNNQIKSNQDFKNIDKYPNTNYSYMRPHDHQVPSAIPIHHDDLMIMSSNRLVERKNNFHFFIFYF